MRSLPLAGLVLVASALQAAGQETPGGIVQKVRFDQNLGARIEPGLTFRDEAGRAVTLGDYLGKRPVILTFVYYNCPMLCTQELNSLTRSLRTLSIDVGKEFDILTVSINPEEAPELAARKKRNYLDRYDRAGADRGWHFLTGDEASIRKLADEAGFHYVYNPKTKLYAHAAGLVILSADGTITKYFSGIDYPPKDIRRAVDEARGGRVGPRIANMVLLCYDYDPATGRYTLAIMRLLRILGTATVIVLASSLFFLTRRDRRRRADTSVASIPLEA